MTTEISTFTRNQYPRCYRWLLVGLVMCLYATLAFWPELFFSLGLMHYGVWFLDSFAILASNDAVASGLDPYAPNSLDIFRRPHVYSHWWLWLGDIGLTRAHNAWVGLTWVGMFIVTAFLWLRPRNPRELLGFALILASPPILLALNRANNDLVIFVLLSAVVPCLCSHQRAWRWLAVLWIALATGLKYYPASVALVLLAGDDSRELRARIALMMGAFILVGLSVRHDLGRLAEFVPQPEGFQSFGASIFLTSLGWNGTASKFAALIIGGAFFICCWRIRWLAEWPLPVQRKREYMGFVLGAVLLSGCFWTNINFSYRWVFAIWLAPWLWRLAVDNQASWQMRRLAGLTCPLLLLVLWGDALLCALLNQWVGVVPIDSILHWAEWVFLLEQPFVWSFFLCLLAFLAQFSRQGLLVLFGRSATGSGWSWQI